jgi:hypothetical protein
VKRNKCLFGVKTVAYLGHIISEHRVAMDADKVEAVKSWLPPRTVCAVCGFLGLTGYYRRFIRGYGDIVAPLTQLLKCEAFCWFPVVDAAFDALKAALTSAPVLQLLDFSQPFVVDCDALGSGFDVVLHQGAGPLVLYSHAIAPHQSKLVAYERELIGLVKAVKH